MNQFKHLALHFVNSLRQVPMYSISSGPVLEQRLHCNWQTFCLAQTQTYTQQSSLSLQILVLFRKLSDYFPATGLQFYPHYLQPQSLGLSTKSFAGPLSTVIMYWYICLMYWDQPWCPGQLPQENYSSTLWASVCDRSTSLYFSEDNKTVNSTLCLPWQVFVGT